MTGVIVVVAAVGEIIKGKRVKKTVERLDFQAPKQMEKLQIGDGQCCVAGAAAGATAGVANRHFLSVSGSGEKLGLIPRTGYQITKMKPADLKALHVILFDRPGKVQKRTGDIDN